MTNVYLWSSYVHRLVVTQEERKKKQDAVAFQTMIEMYTTKLHGFISSDQPLINVKIERTINDIKSYICIYMRVYV